MSIKLVLPLYCVAVFITVPVVAQQRGTPGDKNASAAALKYDSSFAGYRPYQEEPIEPWPDSNETVARPGGHGAMRGGMVHTPARSADAPRDAVQPSPSKP